MAALRSQPVGSTPWINNENEQVTQFCTQEAEDFAFSARNEAEWLNEHMAEIFSKSQVNVTEIFKTPGKLRGKTPRTAKKRNPLEVREPLSNIFKTNALPRNSPSHRTSPSRTAHTFQVAEDPVVPVENTETAKVNTDAGYHELTEDDMAIDQAPEVVLSSAKTHNTFEILPKSPQINQISVASQSGDTTERSFHSAKERTPREDVATQELKNAESLRRVVAEVERMQVSSTEPTAPILDQGFEDAMDVNVMNKDLDEDLVVDESRSPSQGSSPARTLVRKSSLTFAALPAREPLTTKKSIGARVSRTSHLDQCKAAVNRGSFLGRFTGGKSLGGLRQPEIAQDGEVNDEMDIDTERPTDSREESDGDSKMAKLHNKSSTQRLHDRINMLGKSQPPRPTKSIAAAVNIANSVYPDLSTAELSTYVTQPGSGLSPKAGAPSPVHDDDEVDDDEDDDWIQPPQTQLNGPNRPQLSKSISADVMEDIRGKQTIGSQDFSLNHSNEQAARKQSPLRDKSAYESRHSGIWLSRAVPFSQSASPAKAVEQAAPMAVDEVAALDRDIPAYGDTSTTPSGSPLSRRYVDGPLSASKSKLQSIMKTARGLFSSSAGVSAQAKMETLSPPSMRTHEGVDASSINTLVQSKTLEDNSTAVTSSNDIRKTRSSTDIEQKRKLSQTRQRQKAEEEPEWIREQESQKLLARKQAQTKTPAVEVSQLPMKPTRQSPRKTQNHEIRQSQPDIPVDDTSSHSMGLPVPHVQTQQPQLQRPKEVRRPIKPAKETAPKPKPQPVAIRVGTLSQRIPLTNATLSSGLQESLPSAQPKQPANGKKPSNASLQTLASNSSLKGSVTSVAPKPKALLAAERKKEQDEKEAQRKLDQKRDMERKRAVQQEEARRLEQLQRQEAERQRERERAAAEDPKKVAQKQAIEKRRLELNKKEQQQRMPQRPGADHVNVPQQQQAASSTRQDLGGSRPPSRLHNIPDHSRFPNNHPPQNSAKPANKRVFNPDADDEPTRLGPSRPQGGPLCQQNDGKRRKTEDEDLQEIRVRPTMAPPIRQSGIRKDGPKASIFNSNYNTAPPPAPQHHNASSLLKTTTANQAYQQHAQQNQIFRSGHHPDTAKYTNGKIPFADVPNPPLQSHKTPLPSKLAAPPAKPSPQYINGENIHLEDIPTESEESDSEDEAEKAKKGANLPEWAQSPQLRQLLMTQDEKMDADTVFGPVASPHMEEMFRERHHRFRSRTSSANWAGADRLTEEEIRRDVEARQRLRREGGWTFGL